MDSLSLSHSVYKVKYCDKWTVKFSGAQPLGKNPRFWEVVDIAVLEFRCCSELKSMLFCSEKYVFCILLFWIVICIIPSLKVDQQFFFSCP